jgi:hypothetical protein
LGIGYMTVPGRYGDQNVDMHLYDLARTVQADKDRAIEAAGRRHRLLDGGTPPEPTPVVTRRPRTRQNVGATVSQCTAGTGPARPATP